MTQNLSIMIHNNKLLRTLILSVLMSVTAVTTANATVGDKFKVGQLFYKVTAETPNKEVMVAPQGDYGYTDESEKPTGDITIPKTVNSGGVDYNCHVLNNSCKNNKKKK